MHGSPLDWWFERCRRAHAFARTRLRVYTIIGRPPTCLRDVPKSPGRTGSVDAYDGRALEISRYPPFEPDPRKAYCAPAILGGQPCSGGELWTSQRDQPVRTEDSPDRRSRSGTLRGIRADRRRRNGDGAREDRQDRTRIRPICNGCCQDGGALRPSQAHLDRAARAGASNCAEFRSLKVPSLNVAWSYVGTKKSRIYEFALRINAMTAP
jgi:hypothetical protein